MIMRFIKEPGSSVLQSTEEPAVLLGDDIVPDDITLPPELGGHIERVLASFKGPCPHCGGVVQHHRLTTCSVAECNQFYWYKEKS
jgi:hypothetical protein